MNFLSQDLLSLLVALVLGAAIGIERELSDKAAGLRTNILICVGASLFTILSQRIFGTTDGHLVAQIVSGIGFLGAGAIMRNGDHVSGLTTAATVWIVAAVGMAVGFRHYQIAAFTAVIVLVVQSVFPALDAVIDDLRQRHTFRITSDFDDDDLEEIKTLFRQANLKVLRRKIMKKNGLFYSEWYVAGPRLVHKDVLRQLMMNKNVQEVVY
jgi:putative Mg2+ transporter-C (MgtC) family protein